MPVGYRVIDRVGKFIIFKGDERIFLCWILIFILLPWPESIILQA